MGVHALVRDEVLCVGLEGAQLRVTLVVGPTLGFEGYSVE